METSLTDLERRFVHDLLMWNQTRRSVELLFFNVLLILGGMMIIVVAYLTLQYLSDRTVALVTVPGLLMGVLLVGLYVVGRRRIQDRQRVCAIIKKLTEGR